jgi:hypothetical protein
MSEFYQSSQGDLPRDHFNIAEMEQNPNVGAVRQPMALEREEPGPIVLRAPSTVREQPGPNVSYPASPAPNILSHAASPAREYLPPNFPHAASVAREDPAPNVPNAASPGIDLTMQEFFDFCHIDHHNVQIQALCQQHLIFHWRAFVGASTERLEQLGFPFGPSVLIAAGTIRAVNHFT